MTIGTASPSTSSGFTWPFSMAFQPIVDLRSGRLFAQEALVRGVAGEGAETVLSQVTKANRHAFDRAACRCAIEHADRLNLLDGEVMLSINFMPNAICEPERSIRHMLVAAEKAGIPPRRIILEFTETEKLDITHVRDILRVYRANGFRMAMDDFGSGYSGLLLLTQMQPDIVKIDMGLILGIDADPVKQTTLRHVAALLGDLGVTIIAEGVETQAELEVVRSVGIDLVQGYLLARPRFEALACPDLAEFVET
ncbi:EAL domain-containing protein [Cereibacter changlensis]|uniref:EAL domain-containing protein n=1 Tax=Cereibacter changlensis TaxID=402884 RepID=A0A4V5NLI6_9RHOB|nr:EAL domain-containing protein [Cereibacter changlensis]TKA95877.1 EAL domain-containing protein [Cereibacter changlensis]